MRSPLINDSDPTQRDKYFYSRAAGTQGFRHNQQTTNVAYCDTSHMDQASQYKFIIRLPDGLEAEQVKKDLIGKGIICGGGVYDAACHQQPVFADVAFNRQELTVTETWCPRHICPPITSGTTHEDARRIVAALTEVLG